MSEVVCCQFLEAQGVVWGAHRTGEGSAWFWLSLTGGAISHNKPGSPCPRLGSLCCADGWPELRTLLAIGGVDMKTQVWGAGGAA